MTLLLFPKSGFSISPPWLVLAARGARRISLDLRILDRVVADGDLVLECNEHAIALHVADGPEATEQLAREANRFTRENAEPIDLRAERLPACPKLVVLEAELAGRVFELGKREMTVGRTDGHDIVIDHRSISRDHARLRRDPATGRYAVVDLHATNGVRVNGERCIGNLLRDGDIVDLGHICMRYMDPADDVAPPLFATAAPERCLFVGADAVVVRDEHLHIGATTLPLAELAELAEQGRNVRLDDGTVVQAALAMLAVSARR